VTITFTDEDNPFAVASDSLKLGHINAMSGFQWVGCGGGIYVIELLGKGFVRIEQQGMEVNWNYLMQLTPPSFDFQILKIPKILKTTLHITRPRHLKNTSLLGIRYTWRVVRFLLRRLFVMLFEVVILISATSSFRLLQVLRESLNYHPSRG
jgi:hypothetical protein